MDIYAFHAEGLSELEAEQGDDCPTITWNDTTWQVLPGGVMLSKDLASGGFALNADARFTMLFQQFADNDSKQYPDAQTVKNLMLQTELDYLGDKFKITSVTIMGNGWQLHIEANSLNKA